MFRRISLLVVFVFCCGEIFQLQAQFAENLLLNREEISESDSNRLFLKFANSNFVKDNEYFNNIVEGYTLIGYWLTTRLEYHPSPRSSVEGGIHLLKFAGRDNYFKVLPVFTFSQQITPGIQIVLGTLKSAGNHNMPEPLLDPERFYFDQVEDGVQFLFKTKRFNSDVWLSWDNFIWYGDSGQERLTFGASAEYEIFKNSEFRLSLPLHTIFTHRGGQINRPKQSIETIMNLGSGIYLDYKNDGNLFRGFRFRPEFFLYGKLTSDPLKVYNGSWVSDPRTSAGWAEYPTINNGWAVYPNILFFEGPFLLKLSYWYSDKFYGPKGEAIYQSVSTVTPGYVENNRSLAIGKLGYSKHLGKSILLTTGFEGYYDTNEKIFDYNISINICFNQKFLLHNF